jgi:hypothetical protein
MKFGKKILKTQKKKRFYETVFYESYCKDFQTPLPLFHGYFIFFKVNFKGFLCIILFYFEWMLPLFMVGIKIDCKFAEIDFFMKSRSFEFLCFWR